MGFIESVYAADTATAKLGDLEGVIGSVMSSIIGLVGMASVVMFLYGGFQFLMAGNDKGAAGKARATLTYAVIGLVVTGSTWLIINFFGRFFGISGLETFSVCIKGSGPDCR